jgi:hypothetical protein
MADSLARSPWAITSSPSTSCDGIDPQQFEEIVELLAEALVMDLEKYPNHTDDSSPRTE